ncbi:toll/interleukin-1 receptor domain-containing protein [Frankia gtarii]|uniref:toll/interleukin-1 receptor domain-containing protein n=1 Tax=Frankia gtarii TaxID=2950102 RepID=UPI0021BFEE24|nr:toll/interleukin-1 receptor domain-containing protein [Frankia gtarii]
MSPVPAFGRPGRLPGQAPPVWRSRRENELFVGRDDELERVWDGLCRHGHLVVVPEGDLSDIGETELAAEYQHRYKLRYDVAWWVDCSPGHDIAAQLAQLADQARARLAECAADAVPEPGEGWLLIFAGVDSPEDVEPHLPGGGAHCLIVADRTVDSWRDRTVPIGPLRRPESVMLLTSAAPMVDPATAASFGERLGHRPALLAELAGYLIRETMVTPELCQRLFEMAEARPGPPAVVEAPPGSSNGAVPVVGGDPRAKGDPPGEATPTAPRGDVSGSPAQAAEGAIAVAGGDGGALEQPAGAREVDALVAALMQVEYIADVVGFEHWQAELTRLSGRTVVLTSRWLAVRLTTLVTEAVRQPGPGMLDALVQSLELVASRDDRAVAVVRRLVSEQATGRAGGLEPFADAASQASASAHRFDSWPLADGAVSSAPPPTRGPAGADAYYFFTSHAHRHDRDRVVTFHRELEAELRRKARRRVEPAGFLDAERMGGGEHWPTALREAVRTAPVLVALWCDDYFESEWCGQEFGVFQERIRRATGPGGKPPAGIIPVPWLVREAEVPEAAQELHIAPIELGRKYDNMPVLDLMRHPVAFAEYVSLLAYRVMDVARDQLPPLAADAADRVRSPFHPES